ncbi:MAG TPA: helix-turn-helix transcriptional regulator, partial [Actinopolymorphaceae bacterium]
MRRLRLATELQRLREDRGLTIAQLGSRIDPSAKVSKTKISYLENGHSRPDPADVIAILEALKVEGDEWTRVMGIASDAAERGWWESSATAMGQRQALYANLEAGATTIRDYQLTYIPGLLQTPEFVRALTEHDDLTLTGPTSTTVDGMLRGRTTRQRMIRRPDGPTYRVVIDELAVRRPCAPAPIHAAQLRALASGQPENIEIRVLPVAARIEAFSAPKSTFSLYTFADPEDPVVGVVDTVTRDDVLATPEEVDPYEKLWARLYTAALSVQDSA